MTEWNKKYREMDEDSPPPSRLLQDLIKTLPAGRALDLASGTGRNALFLASHGYDVDALDSSSVAIEKGRRLADKTGANVNFITKDLKHYTVAEESYDLIINFNFLERSLIPSMIKGLKKGGVIIFETYTVDQVEIGPPRNPVYLLAPNELLSLFGDLYITFYREGVFEERDKKRALASIVARRQGH